MPLPLLIVVPALVTSGVIGVKKTRDAYSDKTKAKDLRKESEDVFNKAKQRLLRARRSCTKDLKALGELKFSIWDKQIGRFVSLFELLHNVELSGTAEIEQLGAYAFSKAELAKMKKISVLSREVVGGGTTALGSGALVGMASYGGAAMLATASTGTAISSLSGVAATNATMAWFGGGSLAAGGLGMAGGAVVLGGIVAAPVLAVGGIVLASHAKKELAAARVQLAKALTATGEMRGATSVVNGIRQVAKQFHEVITNLNKRTTPVLDDLAAVIKNSGTNYAEYTENDKRKIHVAVMFIQALKVTLDTPFLTKEGALTTTYPKALEHGKRILNEEEKQMADKGNKLRDKAQDAAAFSGSMVATEAERVAREADATDMLRGQLELFLDKAKANTGNEQLKGFIFERIEAGKFNVDAVRKGSEFRANVTSEVQGRGTDPVDIEIVNSKGKVLREIQAKTSNSTKNLTKGVQDPKYAGMKKLVPQDQATEVREQAGETDQNINDELKHKNVSSGGTPKGELKTATEHPKFYALKQETLQVARETGVTGLQAAATGGVIGGALSFVKNAYAYQQGDIDGQEAMKNVTKDTAKAGIRSGSTGALGTVIRHGASTTGGRVLAKSNVAIAIASGIIDAGGTVYRYVKGEISAEEAAERLGKTGCSNLSGIYVGATAGAIFGPPGAVVGSIAGYMLAASVYQSCIVVIKEAQLAEKEAERVEDLCIEAAKIRIKQREQFRAAMADYMSESQAAFDEYFETIDQALVTDQPIEAIHALSNLTIRFGKELKLADFEDFDEFMTESDEPLVL